ncbi:ribosome recycling factor [candidate division WOR-1 bacterium RIFCSPLOWO2_02_FULL_46_20]|uniref:Ribosome-recycling factor n=2 Tax=Saganbacteria TaxID=1703751 RepID=A0A1F4REJ4_UNCSA|nr:MAG: ribosome recycling factor [candidate division WOR-1 bacterium RIFCSPHIGHO2_02_FULL_45_12]OGC06526.1 MAG: ribosome recycling factor [candidate division WOR-1 bacterium RIFCSPLOWO2_02_FULL_46_20]OGC09507.1 MAG: ribosome recycling factor [candidate division WOR-1 bacterium RIFCSPLOWO2_12_FULL_45_9]
MLNVLKESEAKMEKAIVVLKKNFVAVRTGRANPSLLDHVVVSYYGAPTPLRQLASISVPEPRMLVVTPYDKNSAQDIEKAILTSDLGLNPRREAGVVRLTLPEPSEERRKELVKVIKKESEDAKIAIRNIRREANENLRKQKNDKTLTEDDEKAQDKKVQDLTNKCCAEVDKLYSSKEKEIMEV